MSQESEQAQEAWIARGDAVSSMRVGDYLLGHDELKAALKAEIEKEMKVHQYIKDNPDGYSYQDEARALFAIKLYNKVLSLLDTVKPL